ncbi:CaiB/BaiF CoA transferase family protein [Alteribacter populi]|uniref:CaiB/BaiF CoA transferase family protein n=1 Tax=Alteribacter populi TaxID=2011011 RepID=UPI000BBB47F8|nr:CaiB/BaiF CoA-transferase family protein [Alteribacter populi]
MLKGIRVIDFSFYLPGPYASLRLADLGAEVIKVEPPEGDPARTMGDQKDGTGLVFLANNRHKKSIVLNLKEAKGQQIALDLIKEADVVIESFRPGVAKRLGIDYERVKKEKPDIVYCSISGYGQSGKMNHLGSHDLNYMSVSGALAQMKNKAGEPVHPTNTFADLVGGIAANEAILAALINSSRTGKGEHIDLALTDVMVSLMTNHVLFEQEKGQQNGISLLRGEIISYKIYQTKDHRFVSLAALEKKFWENFCHGVDRVDWIGAHFSASEEENQIYREVVSLFSSRTLEEWTTFSMEVDCCLTPVLEPGELIENEYIKDRSNISDTDWGIRQVLTQPHAAIDHSLKPPAKGENTEEVLTSLLNMTEENIRVLKNSRVL